MKKKIKWRVRGLAEFIKFQYSVMKLRLYANKYRSFTTEKAPFPVSFISGCGRSGTTLLGRMLGLHFNTYFYDEPRPHWVRISPKTDIWGYTKHFNTVSFHIDKMLPSEKLIFDIIFNPYITHGKNLHIIEKTPENIFRIAWLKQLAPRAKFIHIVRNGDNVIRSILKKAEETVPYGLSDMNNWYGKNELKIKLLLNTASFLGIEGSVLSNCKTHTDFAALEWICSHIAYEQALRIVGENDLLLVRYEDILIDPWGQSVKIMDFINLAPDPALSKKILMLIRPAVNSHITHIINQPLKSIFDSKMAILGYV